jgi:hypothetical protein
MKESSIDPFFEKKSDDVRVSARGGKGCLVLIWLAAVLALAACAGWVVQIWQRVL